jgi:CheY-like chemotaxis protein/anti-sigma regulatory factor (Ser/Thr protein kinase)
LQETVHEALALVEPIAAKQDISLTLDMGALDGGGHVFADRQRLKQVLLNLLSNAIKYNRAGGDVQVSFARSSEGRIRIVVADTGPGIPDDRLDRLFEPFERLDAEYSEIEGTGLGLALSRRLVEAMGGSLEVESEPGKGSTFTIELDTAQAPGSAEVSEARLDAGHEVIAGSSSRQHRILYIEDNLSNLTLVERILERHPSIDLLPVMQGTLGLELAREHHPDLIVLDLHLPDISGEEVLSRLKADEGTRTIPVVVLSADASKRQLERLLQAGAQEYLTKPLDVQRFLEVIATALDRGGAVGAERAVSSEAG